MLIRAEFQDGGVGNLNLKPWIIYKMKIRDRKKRRRSPIKEAKSKRKATKRSATKSKASKTYQHTCSAKYSNTIINFLMPALFPVHTCRSRSEQRYHQKRERDMCVYMYIERGREGKVKVMIGME